MSVIASQVGYQGNTTRLPNAGLMFAHRLRRWANISPALGKRVVFAAMACAPSKHDTTIQCWANVGPLSTTLAQHRPNIVSMCRVCWAGLGRALQSGL